MSDFLEEQVPRMPPLSMADIEKVSVELLEELCPEALKTPTILPFIEWVDHLLPKYGIHVYPAREAELGDRLAATDPSGGPEITILLAQDLWDSLFVGGRVANRARATLAHEFGHAVLHVPVVRRRMKSTLGPMLLSRVRREHLPPYEDPEWQAWALAGCILAPRMVVSSLESVSAANVASAFGMSEGMAQSHLKRLRFVSRSALGGAE